MEPRGDANWNKVPSRIMLSGLVDSDRKIATMMDSFAPRRMVHKMFEGLPTHRRSVIDEATLSETSDKVHHLKIKMRIKGGRKELDVWPIRKGVLDMHRNKVLGGLQSLKSKLKSIHQKRLYVNELGKPLRDGSKKLALGKGQGKVASTLLFCDVGKW